MSSMAPSLNRNTVLSIYDSIKMGVEMPSDDEMKVANRNVKRIEGAEYGPQLPHSSDNVIMYIALRRMLGQATRINVNHLLMWNKEVTQEVALVSRYWARRKEGFAVPDRCKPYLVNTDTLEVEGDWARDTMRECYIFDSACPKEWLGPGLVELSTRAATRRSGPMQPAMESPVMESPRPRSSSQQPLEAAPPAPVDGELEGSQTSAATTQPRVGPAPAAEPVAASSSASSAVQPQPGTPPNHDAAMRVELAFCDEEFEEGDLMMRICHNTLKAIEEKKWSSRESLCPGTVHFWYRHYVQHVKDLRARFVGEENAFVASLQDDMRRYPLFVLRRLFSSTWADLRTMAPLFVDLASVASQLLPDIVHALLRAADTDILADSDAYKYNELPLQQKEKFFSSPLYKDFLRERSLAFIDKAKLSSTLTDAERHRIVAQELERLQEDDESRTALGVVKTLLCEVTPFQDKVDFVVGCPSADSILQEWSCLHMPWLTLVQLLGADTSKATRPCIDSGMLFLLMDRLSSERGHLPKDSKAQSCLEELEAVASSADLVPKEYWKAMVQELVCTRLFVTAPKVRPAAQWRDLTDKTQAAAAELWKKWRAWLRNQTVSNLLFDLKANVEAREAQLRSERERAALEDSGTPEDRKRKATRVEDKTATGEEEAKGSKPPGEDQKRARTEQEPQASEAGQKPQASEAGQEPQASGQEPRKMDQDSIEKGDTCVFSKRGKVEGRCVVTTVLARHARVRMLDGPDAGDGKEQKVLQTQLKKECASAPQPSDPAEPAEPSEQAGSSAKVAVGGVMYKSKSEFFQRIFGSTPPGDPLDDLMLSSLMPPKAAATAEGAKAGAAAEVDEDKAKPAPAAAVSSVSSSSSSSAEVL